MSVATLLRRFGPLLGLLALCAVLGTLSDHFLTFDNLINVFRQSAVNALLSDEKNSGARSQESE